MERLAAYRLWRKRLFFMCRLMGHRDPSMISKVYGQVQFDPEYMASLANRTKAYQPMLPAPDCPWYKPMALCRIDKLKTAEGAIEYIAAIMNAYATDARRAGYGGMEGRMWESVMVHREMEKLGS
jgi:hypothetical protein